jgi:hypothetical protein
MLSKRVEVRKEPRGGKPKKQASIAGASPFYTRAVSCEGDADADR